MEYFNYNSEKILLCDANEYFGTAHLERESDHKIPFLQQRAMILSLLRENGYADATIQGFQNQNTSYFVREAIYKIAQDTAVADITGPDEVKYDDRGEAIDFKTTIEYIKNYADKDYEAPEKQTDPNKRAEFEALKKQGQKACGEMKKMRKVCCDKFNLKYSGTPRWLNGLNANKIANYLWVRLCWHNNSDGPDYISLFARADGKFEFALELDGKKARDDDQSFFKKHHTFLELPIKAEDNLTFVQDNQKNYDPAKLNQEREDILSQINSGTWEGGKIKLSRAIEDSDEITNDDYYQAMLEAVQSLIPYYNHVLGLDGPSPEQGQEQKQELVPKQEQEPGQEPEHDSVTPSNLQKNLILYGPPGTGKTYVSKIYAVDICKSTYNGKTDVGKYENYDEVAKEYKKLVGKNRICFTTFHQSYGYEEFIEGIKPDLDSKSNDVKYKLSDGLFKSFCKRAKNDSENNYVFVIDEINRGNISKIFGELITLIESSKREGMPEETSCILPYSQDPFTIPQNVYILGTMNTADRSIAMMDTALRRRFDFIEMMPDPTKITAVITEGGKQLKVSEMLKKMNERIELLYDREHTIGHSFFMSLNHYDHPTVGNLADIFKNRIIPLLQEYFYDDYYKIKLVLGASGIIKEENVKPKDYFTENDEGRVLERKYSIDDNVLNKIDTYIKIYKSETINE